jgi:hypothetical protein
VPLQSHLLAKADVAINYLHDEQADADEAVALIEKAGRGAVAIPGFKQGGVLRPTRRRRDLEARQAGYCSEQRCAPAAGRQHRGHHF